MSLEIENNIPLVSICCLTYNHEPYIKQALDSFLMQQTNFAFEIVIHDDASTDNTAKIIEEYTQKYPEIFKPLLQTENQRSKFGGGMNPRFNFPRARGKYIAICEGDDYWTDSLKLQKQVDFLEENKAYGICWTKFNKIDDSDNIIEEFIPKFQESLDEINLANFFNPYRTWTLTTMFRSKLIDCKTINTFNFAKDNTIYFMALSKSKGKILNFNSANYRIHEKGVWSSNGNLKNNINNYFHFNEIKIKIVNHNSIRKFLLLNLEQIYSGLIGKNNCKTNDIVYYFDFVIPILTKLSLKKKITFFKWFILKITLYR